MWLLSVGIAYLKHLVYGKKPRQIHSPYLFDLLTFMFDSARKYYAFEVIEQQRRVFLADSSTIPVEDLGAGSHLSGKKSIRSVSKISRTALASPKRCRTYFRLVAYTKATCIVEMGTSLGISTAYLAAACGQGVVFGLEGSAEILAKARDTARRFYLRNINFVQGHFDDTLPSVLQQIPFPDLVLIDGNHQKVPTLRYFELIKHHRSPQTIVIIDDIRWSRDMYQAWNIISDDPDVTAAIDCFFYGMIFFRPEFREKVQFALKV